MLLKDFALPPLTSITLVYFRLAALISLNLNIKETAALLNISPNSVKLARHRLRQRLAIKTGVDLHVFLHNL